MTAIALITEGPTDQAVLENILYGFLKTTDIQINPLQPLRDETDRNRAENFGNWLLVLEYCRSKRFRQAFQVNDYVVVQIDTDVCEDPPFNVQKLEAGRELSPDELIVKVRARLIDEIGPETYAIYQKRIIFAICVHTLECWLLPIFYTDNHKSKIKGCSKALHRAVKNRLKQKLNKDVRSYDRLSNDYIKHKTLMRLCKTNPSLNSFIIQLAQKFNAP